MSTCLPIAATLVQVHHQSSDSLIDGAGICLQVVAVGTLAGLADLEVPHTAPLWIQPSMVNQIRLCLAAYWIDIDFIETRLLTKGTRSAMIGSKPTWKPVHAVR